MRPGNKSSHINQTESYCPTVRVIRQSLPLSTKQFANSSATRFLESALATQLIAHAFGGDTYKLKFGHRGSNHPVLDKIRNRLVITTQNHGYAIKNMPKDFEITHIHANDNTVEGIRHVSKPIFSVQYHPEASAGPHDSKFLFDEFVKLL